MNPEQKLPTTPQILLKEIDMQTSQDTSINLDPSIIFFSVEKCGSTFVNSILKKLSEHIGIGYFPLDNYSWELRFSANPQIEKELNQFLNPVGNCYGSILDPISCQTLEIAGYKKLLVLRDPRDLLTSLYFSMAVSHKIPTENQLYRKEFLKVKLHALRSSIDDYVVEMMPRYLEIYQYYIRAMIGNPDVVFLTYEDMVSDFDSWLDTLIGGLELNVSPQLINQIKSEADFTVDKEDIKSHKRQVTPGDHKRKLKPETIEILNSRFAGVLDAIGYPVSV